jgi:glycolate oxidase
VEAATPGRTVGGALLARLVGICGTGHVISDATTLATYRSDALARYEQVPAVAVLPGTADEVAAVLRACWETDTPWVARGAGTGLSGGALPHPHGVLIVLSRLRAILSVDLADACVVVEPGVTNLAVSRAVAPSHFYPPDPSNQVVCTIGGNVAENAGGAHCFKYGFTTDYVIGLDVVLADGSLVELRANTPGYDLLGAFVGSEGTLGIAVAIHLRVLPVPETVRTMVASFDTTRAAGEAVSRIVAAGLEPAAIELMDALSLRATGEVADAGYRRDAGAALLIELDGPRETCAAGLEAIVALCSRAGARDIRVALDREERELLWRTRAIAYPAMRRVVSAYYVQDGVIPRTRLAEVVERIGVLSSEFGLAVANVFHAGDGNLHPIICYDAGSDSEAARARELGERILHVCLDAGGSITGEHGVGVDKRSLMAAMFAEADLRAFAHLRSAFDPRGLANPGKLLPARG